MLLTRVTAVPGRMHVLIPEQLVASHTFRGAKDRAVIPVPGRLVIGGDTPSLSICFESWPGVLMLRGCSCPHVLEITLRSPASR